MLFVNWRKHYDIPNLIYYNTSFKQDRKAKFFFLSDFIFKLIHTYCFRIVISKYMKYLFFKRTFVHSVRLSNIFYGPSLKYNSINKSISRSTSYIKLFRKRLNLSIRLIGFKAFITSLSYNIKTLLSYNILHLTIISSVYNSLQSFIVLFLIHEYKLLNSILNLSHNHSFLHLNKINKIHYMYYIMYKKILFKEFNIFRNHYMFFYVSNIKSIIYNFFKHKGILLNKYFVKCKTLLFHNIHSYKTLIQKVSNNYLPKYLNKIRKKPWLRRKPLFQLFTITNLYKSLTLSIHTSFNTYFYSNLKHYNKNIKYINFINLSNLVYKKTLLIHFKKILFRFRKSFKYYMKHSKKVFYKFLNNIFDRRQWFIGPTNKIKVFRYITHLSYNISSYFKNLLLSKSSNNNYFYYNVFRIRTKLMMLLGKKSYFDEFIFLNNKKFTFTYIVKYFYNISYDTLVIYYNFLKRRFRISYIGELLLFIEFNTKLFLNKHLSYLFSNFNNVVINSFTINKNIQNFLFIGDVIIIDNKNVYYNRFLTFFNFFYFICPLFFRNKDNILMIIYNKSYNLISSYFIDSKNVFLTKDTFFLSNNSIMNLVKLISLNYRYIKLISKIIYYFYNNISRHNNNINNTLSNHTTFKYWLDIYSFGKKLYNYSFIRFKKSFNLKKKKIY